MLRAFTFEMKQLAAFEPKKRLCEKVINTIATRETRFLFEQKKTRRTERLLRCLKRKRERASERKEVDKPETECIASQVK